MQASLSLNNISCERDERILFNNLTYRCDSGAIVQIVGFNGAGKTSLLHTLCGLRPPATGSITWRERDVAHDSSNFRQSLLYLGHQAPVKGHLTVRENIAWLRSLHPNYPKGDLETALEAVDLSPYRDSLCHSLSAGQRRRVALAQLYLSSAPLWVLDEPFTAIDKAGVARLSDCLRQHSEQGGIVVLTSHQPIALSGVEFLDLSQYQPAPEEQVSYV